MQPKRMAGLRLLLSAICVLELSLPRLVFGSIDWEFRDGPADLAASTPSQARAVATIAPGQLSEGWHNDWDLGAAGYWDLGKGGPSDAAILLDIPPLPAGVALTTVSIRQWIDSSALLNGALSITGATLSSPVPITYPVPATTPVLFPGRWEEFVWTFAAGTRADRIVISAPGSGALIDSVRLETSTIAAPEASTALAGVLLLIPLLLSTLRRT